MPYKRIIRELEVNTYNNIDKLMSYLLNIYLPSRMQICKALQRIYGLGRTSSLLICAQCGITSTTLVSELYPSEMDSLSEWSQSLKPIQTNLKRSNQKSLERLVNIGSYRGFRLVQGLPSRGQRTSSNAQIAKRIRRLKPTSRKSK